MSALEGGIYITSKNHILRYELKPNVSSGKLNVNSDGFRDREYTVKKTGNIFRIIVLGDSETLSRSLALQDTLPKKLEYVLNEYCPGINFEVLNMGVEGYNTIQEFEFLQYKGLKYNPDLVILYYCFNDPDYPEYYFKKNFFNKNFIFIRYIQYRIKKALVKLDRKAQNIKSEEENFRYLYTTECWEYAKEAILSIAELAKKQNFKFVLVVVPEMSSFVKNFGEGYPYLYINEKLASFCSDNKIEFIDPIYLFKERMSNVLAMVISNYDRYKNPHANLIIASYIRDELIKRGIVSCKDFIKPENIN